MWCFQCGAEYDASVVECLECGVGLVAEPPIPAEAVGSEEEEQLAYEFHDWAFESRRMLDQLMTSRHISHAWQGATMIVRADDESAVDDLVEEVEHATLPTLDAELEQVVYEMDGWTAEQQTVLSSRLGAEGIPHEFDANGDLVLHAADEDRVEALLDELEGSPMTASADDSASAGSASVDDENDEGTETADADEHADGAHIDDDADDAGPVDLDGLDVNDVLSKLFGATDRLRKNARDAQGVLRFLEQAPTVHRMGMPFGFERPAWNNIVGQVRDLEELLDDTASDDMDIEQRAKQLRDVLFGLI